MNGHCFKPSHYLKPKGYIESKPDNAYYICDYTEL